MATARNILLMTTSEEEFIRYRTLIQQSISPDCTVDWVADLNAGRETLAKNAHDLWLLDANLGSSIVAALVREAMETHSKAGFIVLYDEASHDVAVEALRLGAAEAVNKQLVDPGQFARCVQHATARQNFLDLQREENDQLEMHNRELDERCKTAQAYAGQVSHQIRTPLTVIKAFAAILADGVAGQMNTKQIEHLKKIIQRVDDLSDMLGEMIESSAAEKQKAARTALSQSRVAALSPPQSPPQPAMEEKPEVVMAAPPPPTMSDVSPEVMRATPPPVMTAPPAVMSVGPPPVLERAVPSVMEAAAPENTASPIQATEATPSLGYSVLIVDDDMTIIEVFSMLIENLGFSVTTAVNGREGLAKFATVKFDLLILDLGIPGDDGLSIYQKILDIEFAELERTPAILLTGSSDEGSIARSANIGAHYVLKDGNAWDNVHSAINDIFNLDAESEAQTEANEKPATTSQQVMA